jgi:hypothetical protein
MDSPFGWTRVQGQPSYTTGFSLLPSPTILSSHLPARFQPRISSRPRTTKAIPLKIIGDSLFGQSTATKQEIYGNKNRFRWFFQYIILNSSTWGRSSHAALFSLAGAFPPPISIDNTDRERAKERARSPEIARNRRHRRGSERKGLPRVSADFRGSEKERVVADKH